MARWASVLTDCKRRIKTRLTVFSHSKFLHYKRTQKRKVTMSTATSSNNVNATPNAQPEIARLENTNKISSKGASGLHKESLPDSVNSGLSIPTWDGIQNVTAKPTDRKTLEGSTPGDFR